MQTSARLLVVALFSLFLTKDTFGFGVVVPTADGLDAMHAAVAHLSHTLPHHVDPLAAYKHTLQAHPLPTKMMTGATLAVCGDAIAQSQDQRNPYDRRRASSFAVFDMAYRALQHFSFPIIVAACHGQYVGSLDTTHIFDASQWAAMEQTLASQLGIVPFVYYPAFFALTGAVQGLTFSAAMARAQDNFLPLMKRNLLFWIPMQFIQFGYIQEDLQIPFLSVCGLAWTFVLSVAAGSTKSYSLQKDVGDSAILDLQLEQEAEMSSIPSRAANATSC